MKPPFETTQEPLNVARYGAWLGFKVGTCHGLWRPTNDAYEILAIKNDEKGNGHFQITMQYFEESAKRDGKCVRMREVFNIRLAKNLLKHGYNCTSFFGSVWEKW